MHDHHRGWQFLVAAASAVVVSAASAHGGGGGGFSGGDSGDSSMNPFTGDSYAYFHCGHNLGEQGMIVPGRPNPQSPEEKARRAANPPAQAGTCVPSDTTNANGARNRQDSDARTSVRH
jgi:hypothetical protein